MNQLRQNKHGPRHQNRWFPAAFAVLIALLGGISAAEAAALPGDYMPADPLYTNATRQRLSPQSQGYALNPLTGSSAPFTWGNGVPNALADYYTYVPLSNADALKLAFPAACGNKSLVPAAAADLASTADCYVITAKRLNHNFELKSVLDWYVNTFYPQNVSGNQALPGPPLLPGFSWPTAAGLPTTTPNPGLIDPNSIGRTNFSQTNPAVLGIGWVTDTYSYGSGGVGWRPPYIKPGAPLAAGGTITGNAPTFFKYFPIGSLIGTTISGVPGTVNTTTSGFWHFPAPSIKGTRGRPILVQWLNELPNTEIPGFDPTVDCSDAALNCFPFNRMVTHVHGAHVGPGSDGLAHASFNPDFSLTGTRFAYAETENTAEQIAGVGSAGSKGTYFYPMTQEAATIWYHDHAVGTTHLNTNQGLAGFFPITDDNEKCLQGIGFTNPPTNNIPCTQVLPTGAQELGFALQDRVLDNTGQFYMPDQPIINALFPTCNQATAATRAATCAPLFMYVKHAANPATLTPAGIHLVPYNSLALDTTIAQNAQAPVLAPSASLEYFGNLPVVNGVIYGKYDVDRKLYRIRFLAGTDSRTWILQLNSKVRGATAISPTPIPFHVIGTEQGFLNNPVSRTQITLMPGERVDVLVDFRAVPAGDNQVILANYGTAGPYQGGENILTNHAVLAADIPEIMAFDVSAVTDTLLTGYATANLRITVPALPTLVAGGLTPGFSTLTTPAQKVRVIALEEITDEFGRIMPTIDRRGYDLPGMPITELIKQNDVEEWDIINTTADTHPMHIHQVAFQVVGRIPYDTLAFVTNNTSAVNDLINNVFLPPTYTATGPAVSPGPFENGWKDTVFTPPGFVTRVRAKFDLLGEYVWHCHILSHEEHDMMRPMKIVNLAVNAVSLFTVPAAAQNDRTAVVTVTPPAAQPGVTYKYVIEYLQTNSVVVDTWHPVYSTGPTPTIAFPRDGIYQLRVKAVDSGINPNAIDSAYTAGSNTIVVAPTFDVIYSPANGSTLAGASQTFQIGSSGNYSHTLWVGTTPGGSDIGILTVAAGVTSIPETGLPINGSTVYVRLGVIIPHVGAPTETRFNDYVYTAASPASIALNVTATAASVITSTGFTANWGAVATATGYYLDVSTSPTFASFVTGYNNRNVANVTTFAITGLSPTTSYYYRVRAHNVTITGANSNTISIIKATAGVFRNKGEWYLDTNGNGVWDPSIDTVFAFGIAGDIPVSGNWSGIGTTKNGVYRNGQWFLDMNGNGAWDPATDAIRNFGIIGDVPVTGDWNGNGTSKIGVYRSNQWFLDMNGNGVWDPATDVIRNFGIVGDIPVTGNWNGTGSTKIGVYRNGQWFLDMNGNGVWDPVTDAIRNFGIPGDIPVTGDWTGDGITKIGVYRNGQWYLDMNDNGAWDPAADAIINFGIAGDKPVPGKW